MQDAVLVRYALQYQYDAAGNLIAVIDPYQHTTRYSYDANGWLTFLGGNLADGKSLFQVFEYDHDRVGNTGVLVE